MPVRRDRSGRRRSGIAACCLAVVLAGCAGTKSYVVLLESPDGSTGKVMVSGAGGQQLLTRAGEAAPLDGSKPAVALPAEKMKQDFGAARAAKPLQPESYTLYFVHGEARLTEASAALLPRIVESVALRPAPEVSVIGHTDTVGKPEYNEGLAMHRAKLIADLLKARGLNVLSLNLEYHGERNLLIPTPDETPEPRNRRVEVSIR
jgi:outer membrane protein OmpA-like peptidoglycan-associated protein